MTAPVRRAPCSSTRSLDPRGSRARVESVPGALGHVASSSSQILGSRT
jgi:hypothetical protein